MIVVDSSALIAILEGEPEAERFLALLRDTTRRIASAVTIYETGVVMGARRGRKSEAELMALIEQLGIEVVPFAEPQIAGALEAYGRYGKGIHPKARLNLGDCVAYALAKMMNAPLLFKGNDFAATDVQLA
ncbi:MAG: ribonuclease VapC [Bradyrhizobium sp.]|jgi:ribonuclease VapC|nr:ribonuclease VapC [Bradyrhizobium sp.]